MKQKPIDSPEYRFPLKSGGYGINFSKWSRENVPKPPHKYKVGDVVAVIIQDEIKELTFDCDGTPLYTLFAHGNGYSESQMAKIKEYTQ